MLQFFSRFSVSISLNRKKIKKISLLKSWLCFRIINKTHFSSTSIVHGPKLRFANENIPLVVSPFASVQIAANFVLRACQVNDRIHVSSRVVVKSKVSCHTRSVLQLYLDCRFAKECSRGVDDIILAALWSYCFRNNANHPRRHRVNGRLVARSPNAVIFQSRSRIVINVVCVSVSNTIVEHLVDGTFGLIQCRHHVVLILCHAADDCSCSDIVDVT
nr:MAG: hypothetical protein [Bee densovirus 1]